MQPFRAILFAADFSENSREAFRTACALAVDNKTRVVVLHVAEPQWSPSGPVYRTPQTIQFHAEEPDQVQHEGLKRKLREFYAPSRPIDVDYQTTEGDAAAEILRSAQKIGSDLIVMGTHGHTGVRRLVTGSVATAVLHGARTPVLALRSGAQSPKGEQFRAILHPTDFSPGSEAALRVARSLAREHGSRLILQHVAACPVVVDGEVPAGFDVGSYRDALEAARERIDGPDLKYPVETWFSRGSAPDEIVRVAKEVGCDLIVMGTHGRTGLARLLMGNTAESVAPEAHCPVIIVKSYEHVVPTRSGAPAGDEVTTVL